MRREADEAKANLLRFREELRSLAREKGRMLATLANAVARRRLSEALEGLSVDADVRALDGVREQIARIATEGQLDRELAGADDALRRRVRAIRDDARREAARRELEERKRGVSALALNSRVGKRFVCPPGPGVNADGRWRGARGSRGRAGRTRPARRRRARARDDRGPDVDEVAVVGLGGRGQRCPDSRRRSVVEMPPVEPIRIAAPSWRSPRCEVQSKLQHVGARERAGQDRQRRCRPG